MAAAYIPSPWGKEYHSLTVREALGAGSAGPGKTEVLINEHSPQILVEHQRCLLPPDHPHHLQWGQSSGWSLFLRRTHPRLEQTKIRAFKLFMAMDPSWDMKKAWNEKKGIWTCRSGFRAQFGSCLEEGDWIQYYSNEYTLILFDELVEFLKNQYEHITSRLRSTDPVLRNMLKIRAMSNPVQKAETSKLSQDPYWVRAYFVDPAPRGRVLLRKKIVMSDGEVRYHERIYLPATLQDNPDKEFVKQYEETLRSKPAHMQKALLDGNWYVTAGSFYVDAWDEKYHVCKPFKIPDTWPRFRACDWGFKTQGTIGWFAIDDDGNLFCERELNFKMMTPESLSHHIKRIEKKLGLWVGDESGITGPADTQLWEERGDAGFSKIQEFIDNGISWVQADKSKGSRARHTERIYERLKDHRNGTTTAGLVFFENCIKCIQTIPAMQADPTNLETVVKGGDDHWHDMISYAVAYASKGSVGRNVLVIQYKSKTHEEYDNYEDRGSTGYGL